MTTETLNPPQADADAANKRAQLEAQATERQIKFDKRYSDKRLADMIAEHDAKQGSAAGIAGAALAATTTEAPAAASAADASALAELEALRKRNAELEAIAAAKTAEPPPQPYSAPKGMLTTMDMRQPGDLQKDEDERRLLMDRAAQLGIANEIPPRANNETIRNHIMRHVATKADEMRQREELDKRRAAGPAPVRVSMRVLPLGHNVISKGIHIPGVGDACYQRGDIIQDVLIETARAHEAAGRGEIVG